MTELDLKAEWHIGDALTVMKTLPDASVDLALMSPPFLALRSYLPADHPDKESELGSEATPGAFVDALVEIVEECRRVLTPFGSLVVELGDTYSGSGGAGGDYNKEGLRDGQAKFSGSAVKRRRAGIIDNDRPSRVGRDDGWPLAKSLTMIPELVRVTLAYGANPLTGRQTERWRIRNVIRWCRANPPVGALADKFRQTFRTSNPGGAPPLDWWNIPTQGFKGSHYATWPKNLLVKPILTMCPEKVCVTCGEPSRRIAETTNSIGEATERRSWRNDPENIGAGHTGEITRSISSAPTANRVTLGWTDCGHDDWRRGVVLDPFAGSGTTLEVATGLGRSCIGIDLDERNVVLAERRVGMFLTVV